MQRREKTPPSNIDDMDAVRILRLRADAKRPMRVNLAETIALSHALIQMAEAARRR